MMEEMIREFPRQMEEAMKMSFGIELPVPISPIRSVLICGMGGSAIGGEFVASFFRHESHVPIVCNRSYDIPSWVNEHSLVILSSYSGNTEETIEAFHGASNRGAQMVVLSSNGKLKELADEHGLNYVSMPPGMSSPRACIGYSMVNLMGILIRLDLVSKACIEFVRAGMQLIKYDQDSIIESAEKVA